MKKFILGSVVLLIFASSIAIFQISCQKTAEGETQLPISSGITQLNKVLVSVGSVGQVQYWIVNYDGTNATEVKIPSLPSGYITYNAVAPSLSPDGTRMFFFVVSSSNFNYGAIYSCNINGTGLVKVFEKIADYNKFQLGGAY